MAKKERESEQLDEVQEIPKNSIRSKIQFIALVSLYLICCVVLCILPQIASSSCSAEQRKTVVVIISGLLSQIALFVTIELVLHFGKKGFVVSLCLNGFHFIPLLIIIFYCKQYSSIPGILIYCMAIFLSVVIYRHDNDMKHVVEQLHKTVLTDDLTGLPNRKMMHTIITNFISGPKRVPSFSVVFIDLDNFKLINDSLGHQIGDVFLNEVVHNLSTVLQKGDVLGRMGGDEFLLVSPEKTEYAQLNAYLEKLIKAVSVPFLVGERTYTCTASFGLARYPENGDSVTSLLKQSDMAMYQAKNSGKNRGFVFDEQLQKIVSRRVQLEQNLRLAIGNGELSLEYRPQFSIPDKKLRGFEVLLRWDSRLFGRIPPSEFIPIAEENGTIIEISRWMFARAFTEYGKIMNTYDKPPVLSVNISVVQFRDENFLHGLDDILALTKMNPHNLEIEITESVFIKSPELTGQVMKQLRDKGIRLALDDFGTGYSSLRYLRSLPLDTVKIDKSFVDTITQAGNDQDIVRTIIVMSHQLGLKVVAEGVETTDQFDILVSYNCDYIQGYLLGKPVPAAGL